MEVLIMFWNKKTILIVLTLTLALVTQVVKADFTFGEPTNLGSMINSSVNEYGPDISADGLELYFSSKRPGGYGESDIWVTTRATKNDPWGEPNNLGPIINTSVPEADSAISSDGLELFYCINMTGERGGYDIYVSTRATINDPWEEPVSLGSIVNSPVQDWEPGISADGLELYFASTRQGGEGSFDLWVTRRATIGDPWEEPVNLGPPVNTSAWDGYPTISADGLTLFFDSDMPGTSGPVDIWVSKRKAIDDDWGEPLNLGTSVNSQFLDYAPNISNDGSMLYFLSDRPDGFGGFDIYQVSIKPIVDLNGDGIVDAADMCIIVDNWHTENTLCDIAPPPLGDGFVDVLDLIVLAEHLFEEYPPVEPVE
jgi:Tol biopolymer transport system component